VVITERPAAMLDPILYRHVGLRPEDAFAVQVKSAGGFRALWSPISKEILVADTRGASDGNLQRLPFGNLPRPLWPFDYFDEPKGGGDSASEIPA
jgi:microcystin degradation protein MlrC